MNGPPMYSRQTSAPPMMQGMHQQYGMPYQQQKGVNDRPLSFDMNEFPTLGGSQSSGGMMRGGMTHGGWNSEQAAPPKPQFTLQNENFPALGGSSKRASVGEKKKTVNARPSNVVSTSSSPSLLNSMRAQVGQRENVLAPSSTSSSSSSNNSNVGRVMRTGGGQIREMMLGSNNNSTSKNELGGVRAHGAGRSDVQQSRTKKTPPSPSSTNAATPTGGSRYGLLGLLNVIRKTNPDLNTLELGSDLTSLGLNLNSPDSLHATFASPYSSTPTKSRPTFSLPECYYMQPPTLNYDQIKKFQLETLFYIFYGMPRDVLQGCAAEELYRRNWRFHMDTKFWFHASHKQTESGDVGTVPQAQYVYFDFNTWDRKIFKGDAAALQERFLPQSAVQLNIPKTSQTSSGL